MRFQWSSLMSCRLSVSASEREMVPPGYRISPTFSQHGLLSRRKVLTENPFQDLEPWDVRKDRKRDRREVTADELQALIATTEGAVVTRSKLSAVDRGMFYRVAVFTGLRSAELGSPKPESFDLEHAEVTVPGKFTKNGDPAVQPLPPPIIPC